MSLYSVPPGFLSGGGEMGRRIREFDWESHPLGNPHYWPPALQLAISLCINSNFPTAVYWGAAHYVLYNDAWSAIPAERHPAALGRAAADLWWDIWPEVGEDFRRVFEEGVGVAQYEVMLPMVRGSRARETWWNYSMTPIREPGGRVGGIFNQGNEITDSVLARRARQTEIERWKEVFRQAPAPIALLRGPHHVYEAVNEAYARLVGQRELIGKTVDAALEEVEGQGFVQLLDGVYRTGEPFIGTGVKLKLQRQAGAAPEDVVLDFIYQPLRGESGEIDGIFVLANDVTQRATAEDELRTALSSQANLNHPT